MIFEIISGGEKTDWVGKEWAGLFFPRGKNGPAHSFPGEKTDWGEIPACYTGPKTCAGHFHRRARNWCQKLAPDQSFIVRHCVKFSVPRVPSNSPWKGFRHNFHALIWATCSRRNFAQMTERCS